MSDLHFCYLHKEIETGLSCKNCGNYICTSCLVSVQIGYICKTCNQKAFSVSDNGSSMKTQHAIKETITPLESPVARNINVLQTTGKKVSVDNYIPMIISGASISFICGSLWYYFTQFGEFIHLIIAYAIGSIVCKTMMKFLNGEVISKRIQVASGIITALFMIYNLVLLLQIKYSGEPGILDYLIKPPLTMASDMFLMSALAIAIWASVRTFKIQ